MVTWMRPQPLATTPTVTVVIPCYNYARYLPDCVASATDQPGVHVDIIIIDDASTDDSAAVAERLASSRSRVQLVRHKANAGHIATYNDGLNRATGDYVVLMSADDLFTPGHLQRAVAVMEARPDVSLVYGRPIPFTHQPPSARTAPTSWTVWPGHRWIQWICRTGHNLIYTPEATMRTDLVQRLNGYDPRLPQAADFHLWLRAALHGNVARLNGCDQGYYRVHGNNMHLTTYAGPLRDLVERRRTFDLFFAENQLYLNDPAKLLRAANSALYRQAISLGREELDSGRSGLELFNSYTAIADELRPETRQRNAHRNRRRLQRTLEGRPPSWIQRVQSYTRAARWRIRYRRWRRLGV